MRVEGRGIGPLTGPAPETASGNLRPPSGKRGRYSRASLSICKVLIGQDLRVLTLTGCVAGGPRANVCTDLRSLGSRIDASFTGVVGALTGTRTRSLDLSGDLLYPFELPGRLIHVGGQRVSVHQRSLADRFVFSVLRFGLLLVVLGLLRLLRDGLLVPLFQSEHAVRQAMENRRIFRQRHRDRARAVVLLPSERVEIEPALFERLQHFVVRDGDLSCANDTITRKNVRQQPSRLNVRLYSTIRK